jgi:hypothetical protein
VPFEENFTAMGEEHELSAGIPAYIGGNEV